MLKALPAHRKETGIILQKAAAVTPSEDDLRLINQYALAPVSAEDVTVVPIRLANTEVDRTYERFTKACLDRLAETIKGKSLMVGHDYSIAPAGRVFDAEVRKDPEGDGHYLFTRAFMSNANPLTADVRMGIAKGASIGFQPSDRICDLCGKDYDGYYKSASRRAQSDEEPCSHIAGRTYDGKLCTLTYGGDLTAMEALEESLVWLGCQRGAETSPKGALDPIAKAAHFDALEQSPSGKGESMKELEEALARIKALEAEKAALAPLAEESEAYRKWLKGEIARLYTSVDDEAAGAVLLSAMADAKAADLEKVRVGAAERQKKLLDPRGGAMLNETPAAPPARRSLDDILNGVRRGGAI